MSAKQKSWSKGRIMHDLKWLKKETKKSERTKKNCVMEKQDVTTEKDSHTHVDRPLIIGEGPSQNLSRTHNWPLTFPPFIVLFPSFYKTCSDWIDCRASENILNLSTKTPKICGLWIFGLRACLVFTYVFFKNVEHSYRPKKRKMKRKTAQISTSSLDPSSPQRL